MKKFLQILTLLLEKNIKHLEELGLNSQNVNSLTRIIGMNINTLDKNYDNLKEMGIEDKKIPKRSGLLTMNRKTVKRNYNHHVVLLKGRGEDSDSAKNFILNHPELLEIKPETFKANIQYLKSLDIGYKKRFMLLLTTPSKKREKIGWVLKEIFGYENLPKDQKPEAISKAYTLVRKNPEYLIQSIKKLEQTKKRIKEKEKERHLSENKNFIN